MDLYTLETGNPGHPAVVLLHGGGLSSKMWQPAVDLLPDYHILAPDLPEQGQSQAIAPFTLEDTAQRVADVIRWHVPGGVAHGVGLSLVGAVVRTLPNTSGAMIPGLNHVWPLQDPDLFCRVLRAWTNATSLHYN